MTIRDLLRAGQRHQQDGTSFAIGKHAYAGNLSAFVDEGSIC